MHGTVSQEVWGKAAGAQEGEAGGKREFLGWGFSAERVSPSPQPCQGLLSLPPPHAPKAAQFLPDGRTPVSPEAGSAGGGVLWRRCSPPSAPLQGTRTQQGPAPWRRATPEKPAHSRRSERAPFGKLQRELPAPRLSLLLQLVAKAAVSRPLPSPSAHSSMLPESSEELYLQEKGASTVLLFPAPSFVGRGGGGRLLRNSRQSCQGLVAALKREAGGGNLKVIQPTPGAESKPAKLPLATPGSAEAAQIFALCISAFRPPAPEKAHTDGRKWERGGGAPYAGVCASEPSYVLLGVGHTHSPGSTGVKEEAPGLSFQT